MQDGLALVSELNEEDVSWIMETGHEQQALANTVIISEGSRPESIFLLLSGLAGIHIFSISDSRLASLGPGEILGEISFLEDIPASATVIAVENSLLLALPRSALETRIANDSAFAARLYKSFALISSKRLRFRVETLGQMRHNEAFLESALQGRYKPIAAKLAAFKDLMHKLDREALKKSSNLSDDLAMELPVRFMEFVEVLNEEIGDMSPENSYVKDKLGNWVQREFLPYLLLTRMGERMYSKPRGYAGDYLTIEWMYKNEPGGSGRLGPLLDRVMLSAPAIQAVRNRRKLLANEILRVMDEKKGHDANITSLACGPGREVFDVLEMLENPERLRSNLIDIDLQALEYLSNIKEKSSLKCHVNLIHGNLLYLATGKVKLDIEKQDLVYSVGLIDYFNDKFVIKLLDYIFNLLASGGAVILGNFHPGNPCKAFCDYVLDWKLNHRTEEDMNRLFVQSCFGRPCTQILFEKTGINLFAKCVKED
ncbi:MAG: cyclic nucleotide-binding domain-containing protein [Acidobacteriota bacterium]|jgi:extracellular factor (EF) 3-hydroxypalmitic acid methyl ester biosynthesis protein